MQYPLHDLLRVRQWREDERAVELARRRAAVEEAEQLVARRQNECEQYAAWRVRREQELYDEVLFREVEVRDLDDLKLNVRLLRENEQAYRDRVKAAEAELATARQALESARQAHLKASRDRGKIEEHRGWWEAEAAREAEAKQELELEDFSVRSPDEPEIEHD
jgi:hypothetical protein